MLTQHYDGNDWWFTHPTIKLKQETWATSNQQTIYKFPKWLTLQCDDESPSSRVINNQYIHTHWGNINTHIHRQTCYTLTHWNSQYQGHRDKLPIWDQIKTKCKNISIYGQRQLKALVILMINWLSCRDCVELKRICTKWTTTSSDCIGEIKITASYY